MKILSISVLIVFVLKLHDVKCDNEKISSKLDLNEGKEEPTNTQYSDSKSSPKIQGVRVTVDAGEVKKVATDSGSKESVEIIENKNKKKIGIRTDITIEVTDRDDGNATSYGQNGTDENDASVPIFKGHVTTTGRPRTPYDPRSSPWAPTQPGRPGGQHHHYQPNVPVYPRTNDGGIYRNIDSWNNYVPITSVWTTERSFYPATRPYQSNAFKSYQPQGGNPRWKPCYCATDPRSLKENTVQRRNVVQSPVVHIDDKLESPFSRK